MKTNLPQFLTSGAGITLKSRRKQQGLSQQEMANRLGINRTTYQNMEKRAEKGMIDPGVQRALDILDLKVFVLPAENCNTAFDIAKTISEQL